MGVIEVIRGLANEEEVGEVGEIGEIVSGDSTACIWIAGPWKWRLVDLLGASSVLKYGSSLCEGE